LETEDSFTEKLFEWYLRKGVILTKDNLAKRNGHGSKKCFFVIKMKQSNIYSSNIVLPDLYGQSSFQPCIRLVESPIFLGIGLTTLNKGLKGILGWERLLLFGRYGYVEIIK
jgi:hypothetical protein